MRHDLTTIQVQAVMAALHDAFDDDNRVWDTGSLHAFVNDMIYMLDGPEQRAVLPNNGQAPDGFVMVPRRTFAEAEEWAASKGYHSARPQVVHAMYDLGLVRPNPSPADAFFTAHPEIPDNADTRAVLAAQEVG